MRCIALAIGILWVGNGLAQTPGRLIAPGGSMATGLQFQSSNIANWAGQLANETALLNAEILRAPIPPALKQLLRAVANGAVTKTAETQVLANRRAPRNQIAASHLQADTQLVKLITQIQQSGTANRELAQAVAKVQYADAQLELALSGIGGGGEDRWRRRVARLANTLSDQANELRAIASDTLTMYDRNLDRAIRQFATGCSGVEQNIQAGATREKIVADATELARRWQVVTAGLSTSTTANPNVRGQATRVDTLFGQFLNVVSGAGGGIIPQPKPPDFGFIRKGSAFAVGAGEGGGPRIRLFLELNGNQSQDFFAYDPNFRGGVRVALADLTGDGIPEIVTAPGPGMPPFVRVFDGRTLGLVTEFLAYDEKWQNGVHIAAADRTRAGLAMIATGADAGGGPHVRIFDLSTGKKLDEFEPYDANFRGGVRVALGDVNRDGIPDVVTAPGPFQPGGTPAGPLVRVFDGRNRALITEFHAYDPRWENGVWVSTGDITKNGRAEVLTGADAGGGPHVRVFDGLRGQPLAELFPFPKNFAGGVRVAANDVNNDGVLDFVCAPGPFAGLGAPPVRIFDGRTKRQLGEFIPFEPTFRNGAFVGAK
jgi:hypothetical protein